jgi:hypothetical protein
LMQGNKNIGLSGKQNFHLRKTLGYSKSQFFSYRQYNILFINTSIGGSRIVPPMTRIQNYHKLPVALRKQFRASPHSYEKEKETQNAWQQPTAMITFDSFHFRKFNNFARPYLAKTLPVQNRKETHSIGFVRGKNNNQSALSEKSITRCLWFALGLMLAFHQTGIGQVLPPDSLAQSSDSLLIPLSGSIAEDSTKASKKEPFDFPIAYKAKDSILMFLTEELVYLYGDAEIQYGDIELKAAFIAINMGKKEVFAKGMIDSSGKEVGKPRFKEKDQVFDSQTLKYNFDTKKGYITKVFTEQEGGFLHSSETKKLENNQVCVKDGKYTTCNLEHPHFFIGLTKAKIIPGDKIVTGPAYLSIADIPIPIGIPFGFFPNKKGSTSGILIPTYGEENRRGFFLRDGGYYWAFSDRMDATLRGDIYSKGTWGLKLHTNYKRRYRFNGGFDIKLFRNVISEPELPDYSKSRDFSVTWNHSQDPKANPNSTLSASVNLSSSSFDQNQSIGANNYLTNTKSSSISYSRRFGKDVNFSGNLRHSQYSFMLSLEVNIS